jgi:hypothetical protein
VESSHLTVKDYLKMNPYPKDSIWIGERFYDRANILRGGLIVGESTYDEDEDDPQWIRYFFNKTVIETNVELRRKGENEEKPDRTFCRLHWFMAALVIRSQFSYEKLFYRTSCEELKSWFDLFTFTNYVVVPVGKTNKSKVTDAQLKAAREPFRRALGIIQPKAAWVLGKKQADDPENTLGVLKDFGVERKNIEVMIPHPRLVSNAKGLKSWERFLEIMQRLNG